MVTTIDLWVDSQDIPLSLIYSLFIVNLYYARQCSYTKWSLLTGKI